MGPKNPKKSENRRLFLEKNQELEVLGVSRQGWSEGREGRKEGEEREQSRSFKG